MSHHDKIIERAKELHYEYVDVNIDGVLRWIYWIAFNGFISYVMTMNVYKFFKG